MNKRKIAELLAKLYLRQGRGAALTSIPKSMLRDVFYLGGILVGLDYKFGIKIPIEIVVPVIVVLALFVEYGTGWLDEKYGFWKIQKNYENKQLTPFFSELDKKIDDIHKKVI